MSKNPNPSNTPINILASNINSGNLLLADAKRDLNILSDEATNYKDQLHQMK